jgi:hypothetical protein
VNEIVPPWGSSLKMVITAPRSPSPFALMIFPVIRPPFRARARGGADTRKVSKKRKKKRVAGFMNRFPLASQIAKGTGTSALAI